MKVKYEVSFGEKHDIKTIIHLILQIFVISGYFIGLFPFMYMFTIFFVVPLTIINLVLSIINDNKSLGLNITNIIMAFFSLIPILGYVTRVVGIVLSILAIINYNKK
jgi:hypothetical protein